MIVGLGTDIVAIARMQDAYARHGERLALRLLAPAELASWRQARDPARVLAKRFAVKEATCKAWGLGISQGLGWRDIALDHDAQGRPVLQFSSLWAARLQERGWQTWVSLSDEREYVVATVLFDAP